MFPRQRHCDPEAIAARASSNGFKNGEHEEKDKERCAKKYSEQALGNQDRVLHVYAAWHWTRSGRATPFDQHKESILCMGASLPLLHELKEFWRFFKDQSTGQLRDRPTPTSLRARAKEFKAGFRRYTGLELDDDDTKEINRWLKEVLPYEEGSDVKDITRPKYNYKPVDLDRNLTALWTRRDLGITHERTRFQFHFLLLLFCSTGARRGAIFKKGINYKEDIHLVLERNSSGEPRFLFKIDQRHMKNNKDPENRKHGVTGRQHPLLRYNAVFFLLHLAVADDALDRDYLAQILDGDGDGPIEWNANALELCICRAIDREGNVDPSKPMTDSVFSAIFTRIFMSEYSYTRASMHMIRRELGKQLDERYTETERSQHITQADRTIFGRSYVASVSSCDGFAAFMGEKSDHGAVDYFQGLSQFWQPNLPTQLTAELEAKIRESQEVIDHDKRIRNAADEMTRDREKKRRQNTLKRLRAKALETYRATCLTEKRQERLLQKKDKAMDEQDPLNEWIPEKGRLAMAIVGKSSLSCDAQRNLTCDVLFLLADQWTVYYRPGEAPREDGCCPYCHKDMGKVRRRERCRHIHRCKRKAMAKELYVCPSALKFCYFCMAFYQQPEWHEDCASHLAVPFKQCGVVTYRSTVVRPAFCLICKQSEHLAAGFRLKYWERDADAIRHISENHGWSWTCADCSFTCNNQESGYYHLHDAHGYNIPKFARTEASEVKPESLRGSLEPLCVAKSEGSDLESLDDLMSQFITFPPTPEPEALSPISFTSLDKLIPPQACLLGSPWSGMSSGTTSLTSSALGKPEYSRTPPAINYIDLVEDDGALGQPEDCNRPCDSPLADYLPNTGSPPAPALQHADSSAEKIVPSNRSHYQNLSRADVALPTVHKISDNTNGKNGRTSGLHMQSSQSASAKPRVKIILRTATRALDEADRHPWSDSTGSFTSQKKSTRAISKSTSGQGMSSTIDQKTNLRDGELRLAGAAGKGALRQKVRLKSTRPRGFDPSNEVTGSTEEGSLPPPKKRPKIVLKTRRKD